MFNTEEFVEAAKNGLVTVEFLKKDTNILRTMTCTLNSELSGGAVDEVKETTINPEATSVSVWSVDDKGWRSFRKDLVQDWKKYARLI